MRINKSYKIIIILLVSMVIIAWVLSLKLERTLHPNILLITVDALRADHLGCYGYGRDTSPNIDKLAKEGVAFLKCFSAGPGTVYSFPAFFTGKYLGADETDPFIDNILDKKFTTLSEYLKSFSYHTAAFVGNSVLRPGRGFEQGFDYYISVWSTNMWDSKDDARDMNRYVFNFLTSYRGNKPLFIWIHYVQPHSPYTPPEQYFNIFYNDRLYKENDRILRLKPKDLDPKNMWYQWSSEGYIPPIVFQKDKYNLNYYIACYDAEIRYTDFYIGELLKNIKDNTIIILSADHGESMGEHNVYFSHGENIYDELLHIPLIIKDNRYFKGGRKISKAVSSVDFVPTILNKINPLWYFFNKNRFNGIDLQGIMNNKYVTRKYIYAYTYWAWSILDIKKNVKYILNLDGREELYFLPD